MNLEPLRRASRTESEAAAARRRAKVIAECDRIVAEAEAEADRLAEQGRLEGERAAAREAARRLAAGRRRGREARLAARSRQVEALRREVRQAALELRDDPAYPALVERLTRTAREQLGGVAEIQEDPSGLGGVIGRHGRLTVDYTLPAIADRVVDGLGEEIEKLWR